MRFSGKNILVTGAASGIGRATAELLAREGAERLLLVDINAAAMDDLQLDSAVDRLAGDVANEAFWDGAELGAIDHAVVNAGVAATGRITELKFADWRHVLSVNLDGAFLTLRAALRAMRAGGSIVTVASAAAIKPEPGIAAYGASKAALLQLSRIAAKEAAAQGIRVNAIAPGGVETPIWDNVPMFAERASQIGRSAAFAEMAAAATALKRYASAAEIAGQIAFLLSDACKTATGATLVTDGGYTL